MNAILYPKPIPSGQQIVFVESVALLPKHVLAAVRRAKRVR